MKSKFLASSEGLCPADSSGFVCSSPGSEELRTFQRERACFGCCGFALCQPSFQHTGAAAGFCIPAFLCFQMPIKFPPPILHGGLGGGESVHHKNPPEREESGFCRALGLQQPCSH